MSTSTTFPNGQTLVSSAQTPTSMASLFQLLIAQALGIDPEIITTTMTAAVGVAAITVAAAIGIAAGQQAAGAGIPAGTTVLSITGTSVTLSAQCTASGSGVPVSFSNAAAWYAVRTEWPQEGAPAWGINEDICFIRATPADTPFSNVRDNIYAPNDSESITKQMAYTQPWDLHFCLYGPNCADRLRLIVSALSLDWAHDSLAQIDLYVVPRWNRPVYAPELFQGQWWPRADVTLQFNELVNESLVAPSAVGVAVTLVKENILTTEIDIGSIGS